MGNFVHGADDGGTRLACARGVQPSVRCGLRVCGVHPKHLAIFPSMLPKTRSKIQAIRIMWSYIFYLSFRGLTQLSALRPHDMWAASFISTTVPPSISMVCEELQSGTCFLVDGMAGKQ
jgi:hypothetical protein